MRPRSVLLIMLIRERGHLRRINRDAFEILHRYPQYSRGGHSAGQVGAEALRCTTPEAHHAEVDANSESLTPTSLATYSNPNFGLNPTLMVFMSVGEDPCIPSPPGPDTKNEQTNPI